MDSRRIYLTHCSAKKNMTVKKNGKKVTPDKLYTSGRIQGFMKTCKKRDVNWAIFSDNYGIWFKDIKNGWYEKHPNSITDKELDSLVIDFNRKLKNYNEIWFYYNPGRFHKLYRKLLTKNDLMSRIKLFTHLHEID